MSCLDCGESTPNPNPLDSCDRLACDNPCGAGPHNSARCETLPSQIENFTLQFFGEVVKTEQNGKVTWSLPCSLDIGLPANPRGVGEGLACYFLRLFMDGITGLQGPQGIPGTAGQNGVNSYSVTLQSFNQPSLAAPAIQVTTVYAPSVALVGMYVFIDTSGWYLVDGTDGNGVLFLTLVKPLPGASGSITAGKLVVLAGYPGSGAPGATGPQGIIGPQGPPGLEPTATNGIFQTSVGSNFEIPIPYTAVTFVNATPQFLAPAAGTYLITVTTVLQGENSVATSDVAHIKLVNVTNSADVVGSEMITSYVALGENRLISVCVLAVTDNPGETIALYAEATSANVFKILPTRTTITWVRIA